MRRTRAMPHHAVTSTSSAAMPSMSISDMRGAFERKDDQTGVQCRRSARYRTVSQKAGSRWREKWRE
jgi:hypothetical protein